MTGRIPALETRRLTKRYGDVLAVDRVDLRVEPGEVYAPLGLNGAGKTTLIRMLLGMVHATEGAASLLGGPVVPGGTRPPRSGRRRPRRVARHDGPPAALGGPGSGPRPRRDRRPRAARGGRVCLHLDDVDALIATVGVDRARELVRSHGRFARLEAVAEMVYARRRAQMTGG